MAARRCTCLCHGVKTGVPVDDPIECVTACADCLAIHWPSILGFEPPTEFKPPEPPTDFQADGETGG